MFLLFIIFSFEINISFTPFLFSLQTPPFFFQIHDLILN